MEAEPGVTHGVGRPSYVIRPHPDVVALAIYVEVNAVYGALVAFGGTVVRRFRCPLQADSVPAAVVQAVSAMVDSLAADRALGLRVLGLGCAVPGLVHEGSGVVEFAPGFGWRQVPLAADLAAATGFPVTLANDARCGAVAERAFGVARGVDDVVYLTGGVSGIGSGIIAGGRILVGARGFAGEFGHTLVHSEGNSCHCGARGCLESEVSHAALVAALGLDPDATADLDVSLAVALEADQPGVRALVERQAGFLAAGLRTVVRAVNPELIVLGGFLGTLYRVAAAQMHRVLGTHALAGSAEPVRLAAAAQREDDVLVGAADLVLAPVVRNPRAILRDPPE